MHSLFGPVDYAREIVVQGSFFRKGFKTSDCSLGKYPEMSDKCDTKSSQPSQAKQ